MSEQQNGNDELRKAFQKYNVSTPEKTEQPIPADNNSKQEYPKRNQIHYQNREVLAAPHCHCHIHSCQQSQPATIVVLNQNQTPQKTVKKQKKESQIQTYQSVPQRPQFKPIIREIIDFAVIKNEIQDLGRLIHQIEPKPQQNLTSEFTIDVQQPPQDKNQLDFSLYQQLQQQITQISFERDQYRLNYESVRSENERLKGRIHQYEDLLKTSDQKILELSLLIERMKGDIQHLQNQLKKNKKPQKPVIEQPVRIVEKIIEKPVERIVERIVDRPVEKIVERIVERPVDRIIRVPVREIYEQVSYAPQFYSPQRQQFDNADNYPFSNELYR